MKTMRLAIKVVELIQKRQTGKLLLQIGKTMPIHNNNDDSELLRVNSNNTQTYAPALRGKTASQENSALSRIEKLLVK